jgi:hypothetical protein
LKELAKKKLGVVVTVKNDGAAAPIGEEEIKLELGLGSGRKKTGNSLIKIISTQAGVSPKNET